MRKSIILIFVSGLALLQSAAAVTAVSDAYRVPLSDATELFACKLMKLNLDYHEVSSKLQSIDDLPHPIERHMLTTFCPNSNNFELQEMPRVNLFQMILQKPAGRAEFARQLFASWSERGLDQSGKAAIILNQLDAKGRTMLEYALFQIQTQYKDDGTAKDILVELALSMCQKGANGEDEALKLCEK